MTHPPDDPMEIMNQAARSSMVVFAVRDSYVALHRAVFASGLKLLLRIVHVAKPPDPSFVADQADALLATLEPALRETERAADWGLSRARSTLHYGQALQGALIGLRHLMLETSILGGPTKVSQSSLAGYQMAVAEFAAVGEALRP